MAGGPPIEFAQLEADIEKLRQAIKPPVGDKSIGEVVVGLDRRIDKLENLRTLIISLSSFFGLTGLVVVGFALWAGTQLRDAAKAAEDARLEYAKAAKELEKDNFAGTIKSDIRSWADGELKPLLDRSSPIGAIVGFSAVLKPDLRQSLKLQGWLECDGGIVLRTEYPELFERYQYTYGGGANEKEFKLPDLQGQFLRGIDPQGKRDKDRSSSPVVGTPQDFATALPKNPFQIDSFEWYGHSGNEIGGIDRYMASDKSYAPLVYPGRVTWQSGSGDRETRPTNVAVYWLVKAK